MQTMRDQTRMALCIFMFAVLAFNPFGALIGSNADSENFLGQHAGRTLKNVNGKHVTRYKSLKNSFHFACIM